MPTLDNKQMMELFKKDMGGSVGAFGGGWQGALSSRYRTGPGRLVALQNSYGGTQDSVSWVFACVSLIASTLGSYPWRLADAEGETLENPPPELVALLDAPNPDWTYFDMVEAVLTDLELVGNSYLLKTETNGLGQPNALYRLRPDRVRIAIGRDGTEMGYAYTPQEGAIAIPYDFDEIIHYRYPNPLDPHYGMGTVEAIASVLDQHTAQALHITGYFQNGARISGVLTIPDTMSEDQFERLKESYRENYAGPANAFKLLIAEGATDYKQISQTPVASGVVDLMKMTKDEILSGFGIPGPLLGGVMENANYKMEESQHIFLRAMIPRARRFAERITVDLARLWGVEFLVDAHANEPLAIRIAHAKEMMGAGASTNEAREAMGLAPSEEEHADKILIPNSLIPLELAGAPPRPGTSIPMGTNGEHGAVAAEAGPAALPAGSTPGAAPTLSDQLEGLPEAVAPRKARRRTSHPLKALSAAERAWGGRPRERGAERLEKAESKPEPTAGVWTPPMLPRGYEVTTNREHSELHRAIREHQAMVLRVGVDAIEPMIRRFFHGQRVRVLSELAEYQPASPKQVAARARRKSRKDLTGDALIDLSAENQRLRDAFLPALDHIGEAALPLPPVLSGGLSWDTQNPRVTKLRDQLGGKITQINDTTRVEISNTVAEGLRRGYSVTQIANGFQPEKYAGVMGVFDQASEYRAEMIARTESGFAFNGAQAASYADAGITYVEILDGEGDEDCAAANGSVWTLEEYDANPLEHPNCSRTAVPATTGPDGEALTVDGAIEGDGAGDPDLVDTGGMSTADYTALGNQGISELPNSLQLAHVLSSDHSSFMHQDWAPGKIAAVRDAVYTRTQAALEGLKTPDHFTAFARRPGSGHVGEKPDIASLRTSPSYAANGTWDMPVTVARTDVQAWPDVVMERQFHDEILVRSADLKSGPFQVTGTRLGPAPENATQLAKDARAIDPSTASAREIMAFGERLAKQAERAQGWAQKKADDLWAEQQLKRHAVDDAYFALDDAQRPLLLGRGRPELTGEARVQAQAVLDQANANLAAAKEELATTIQARLKATRATDTARAKSVEKQLRQIRPMGGQLELSPASNKAVAKLIKGQTDKFPSDWIAKSNAEGHIVGVELPKSDPRAFYRNGSRARPADGEVHLTVNENVSTVVHEMSHRMEYVIPDIVRLEEEYLKMKASGPVEKLSKLTGNRAYKDYEVAYPVDMPHAYMGKVYDRQEFTTTMNGLTQFYGDVTPTSGELFTMGHEEVRFGTYGAWTRNPDYAHLMLGILSLL